MECIISPNKVKTIRYLARNRGKVLFKMTGTDDGHGYGHRNKRCSSSFRIQHGCTAAATATEIFLGHNSSKIFHLAFSNFLCGYIRGRTWSHSFCGDCNFPAIVFLKCCFTHYRNIKITWNLKSIGSSKFNYSQVIR